ncbi:MAG: mechanosensitive ion channel family protein [Thermodesulfobacteriota bacterium]
MNGKFIWLPLLCGLLLFSLSPQASLAGGAGDPSQPTLSKDQLEKLIDLFEDEQQRKEFVRQLRALAELSAEPARPEPAAAPLGFLGGIYQALESWGQYISETLLFLIDHLHRLPAASKSAFETLITSPMQEEFWATLAGVAPGLLAALGVYAVIRSRRARRPELTPSLWRRTGRCLLGMVLEILPFSILLAFELLFLPFLKVRPTPREIVLLLCGILFWYKFAMAAARGLLAPEESWIRLLPLSEVDANYLWVWVFRMARFTAFYFAVTRLMWVFEVQTDAFSFIRGLLLLVYPFLLTVFVLQIRHEMKERYRPDALPPLGEGPPMEREAGRLSRWKQVGVALVRIIWIPALAYVWTVFILLISRYRFGLDYLLSATWGSLLTVLCFWFLLVAEDHGFRRLFAISARMSTRFPELEEKANRYLRFIHLTIRVLIGFAGLLVLAQAWGLPVSTFVGSPVGVAVLKRILTIAITVGLVLVIVETSRIMADRLLAGKDGSAPSRKGATITPLVRTTVVVTAYFVGSIVTLDQVGVDVKPILAGAGIIGLAVGLGAQSLVKDLINGLFILLQNMISVGDVVDLGDRSGVVESVGLRTVQLRDLNGNVHVIPNSAIGTVTNMTKDYSRYVFDIAIAYREDVDEVMEILSELGKEMQDDPVYGRDILEPLEILGLDRFDDSAVIIRARVKTMPSKQWSVGREFNRRLKKIFDERGIEIPFPHRTVYMGLPKEGAAPPLPVTLKRADVRNG